MGFVSWDYRRFWVLIRVATCGHGLVDGWMDGWMDGVFHSTKYIIL